MPRARLRHRGPDDAGTYRDDHAALGFRRLSILDLAGGHQPLANEDGTVWVAFNGEIYNFAQLRRRLEARGHTLRSAGDTEVLVHLYEDEGENLFPLLRGMFALAIWDAPRRTLLIGRDRLGQKPLVYQLGPERITFASELKALLALPPGELPREGRPGRARPLLYVRLRSTPRAILRGVHTAAAGPLWRVARRPAPPRAVPGRPSGAPSGCGPRARTSRSCAPRWPTPCASRMVADVPLGGVPLRAGSTRRSSSG